MLHKAPQAACLWNPAECVVGELFALVKFVIQASARRGATSEQESQGIGFTQSEQTANHLGGGRNTADVHVEVYSLTCWTLLAVIMTVAVVACDGASRTKILHFRAPPAKRSDDEKKPKATQDIIVIAPSFNGLRTPSNKSWQREAKKWSSFLCRLPQAQLNRSDHRPKRRIRKRSRTEATPTGDRCVRVGVFS